jgi:hypothetical protein
MAAATKLEEMAKRPFLFCSQEKQELTKLSQGHIDEYLYETGCKESDIDMAKRFRISITSQGRINVLLDRTICLHLDRYRCFSRNFDYEPLTLKHEQSYAAV